LRLRKEEEKTSDKEKQHKDLLKKNAEIKVQIFFKVQNLS